MGRDYELSILPQQPDYTAMLTDALADIYAYRLAQALILAAGGCEDGYQQAADIRAHIEGNYGLNAVLDIGRRANKWL